MSRPKGFTLIELLIVIAIIAVLLTIIAPALKSAKEHATQAVCLGNQMALVKGYISYVNENKDYLPVGYVTSSTYNRYLAEKSAGGKFHPLWCNPPIEADGSWVGSTGDLNCSLEDRERGIMTGAIYPYVKNSKAYHCPGDRRLYEGTSRGTSPAYHAYRSYNLPDVLVGAVDSSLMSPGVLSSVRWEHTIKKLSTVPFPEDKYCFVEDEYDLLGANFNYDGWSFIPQQGLERWWDPVGTFHVDGCTLAFLDGHASKYKWKDERSVDFFEDRPNHSNYQPGNPDIKWFLYHYPIAKIYTPSNPF